MPYRVFQDGIRCSDYNIKGWEIDTFDDYSSAIVFAFLWAYPVSKEVAIKTAPYMELGVEYDYSMGEAPVMMKIEEVEQ